ncbi:MAG TPA: dihydroorotase [Candidatus Binataceae bacterium]|nr:dihydroorotase [Candidatus Binataceae bacterium]
MSRLLIRGGRLIDPANSRDEVCDVLIADGEIEAIVRTGNPQAGAAMPGAPVIDAAGWWVVPGLIDPHVHLRDPGFPEKETIATGLRAAAAGGFTAVAAMANTSPVNDCPEITRYMLAQAAEVHAARLIPVSAVTRDLEGGEMVDFAAMAAAGARLFSDDGIPIDDQALLARALEEAARAGFAISLHEEDRALTGSGAVNAGEVSKRLGVAGAPAAAEIDRVRRDLALAIGAGAAVHVAHVSTAEALELIRAARKRGAQVTCEVTPHHFALDERAALRWGPNAKMAPPLRSPRDVEAVLAAIADGTIDMIATDHAPHDPDSKRMARLARFFGADRECGRLPEDAAEALSHAANGVVGLETALGLALGLVHRGVIDAPRMVRMMSLNPARLLRIDGGAIEAGVRADLTLIDPNSKWTVDPMKFISKSRNTPFGGRELEGKAMVTIVAGEIVYDARTEARV